MSAPWRPDDCWFDDAAADAACAFFPKYLRHTEGEWAGRPFALQPWQADRIIRPLFGWKRPDGTRRYRRAYIEVPRKNGKTELGAGIALLVMVGDGEQGGQGYTMAVDKDQAKIAFNKATVMVQMSPGLADVVECFKTSLYVPELRASLKPLSSGAANKHGFSPNFGLGDELHEWPNGDVADVVHKGTAARRQPIEVYITTAGIHGLGYGWEMHEHALGVLDGSVDDPEFLAVVFAAAEEDDWTAEETWRKANPNLGVSPKLDYLRSECQQAKESPRKENDFRRFHLNQWTEQVTRWLPMDRWDACAGPVPWQELEEYLAGRKCCGGLDLSTTTDITAWVPVFEPEAEGEPWFVLPRFWCPEETVAQRVKREKLPYDQWVRDGAMTATEGNVVDYDVVAKQITDDAEAFRLIEAAFDRWNSSHLVNQLMADGAPMVPFGQGYASMSAPSKELEALVLGGRIAHGGHPVLRAMAAAVAIETDPAGNIKPSKSKSHRRIDGIVATVMGLGRATATQEDGPLEIADDYEVAVA